MLESTSSWDLGRIEMAAAPRGRGDGYRLNGTKLFVLDGHLADHLLVAATTELGLSLFVVAGDAVGLSPFPRRGRTRAERAGDGV